MSERVAVFAEALLHTSNGKAAHGLIRYGEREVVAVVDSLHAGRLGRTRSCRTRTSPCRSSRRSPRRPRAGRSASRSASRPRAASCRRNGRTRCSRRSRSGLHVEAGLHDELGRDPELVAAAAARGLELRDVRRVPAGLSTPSGAGLGVPARIVHTVGTDCAIGKMTVDARARGRGARGRRARRLRADRADRHLDRRLGHRRRPRDLRLRRRRGRAARARGRRARRPAVRGGAGRDPAPALLRRHARACCTAAPRTCSCSCTRPAPSASTSRTAAGRRARDPAARGAGRAAAAADLAAAPGPGRRDRALDAADRERRRGARGDRRRRGGDRPRLRRPRALRRRAPVAAPSTSALA